MTDSSTNLLAVSSERPQRWRPHRAGIINVWRYADETFQFHRGRLLLRGPNGSGKSMALELLFPYLLDARADRSRLSSAAKSRGGLFDRMMAGLPEQNKVGFLWAEFERPADGSFFTVGTRMRASTASRRITSVWFTTTRRVGIDLQVLDQSRTPLSVDKLREAVESGGGAIYESAEPYRAALRETLFRGFTPEQYEALLSALLALRVEKVSQNITPEKLGTILTDSLPPLDEREIAALAEGFEKLDRRKEELVRLRHQFHHVSRLAGNLRTYARNIVAAQAAEVRTAETQRDDVTRNERLAQDRLADATHRDEQLSESRQKAELRMAELDETIEAYRNREAYRQGAQLEPLRHQERIAKRAEKDAEVRSQRASGALASARDKLALAEESAAKAADATRRATGERSALARDVGASAVDANLRDSEPDRGEREFDAWAQARQREVEEVRGALRALESQKDRHRQCEEQLDEESGSVEKRFAEKRQAEKELIDEQDRFVTALRSWVAACQVLPGDRLSRLLEETADPDRASTVIDEVARAVRGVLTAERAICENRIEAISGDLSDARAERARLVAGQEEPPLAPAGRRSRQGVAGAPLWHLVDFSASVVDRGVQDRIESALRASGLLDAWVTPDGRAILGEGESDAIVTTESPAVTGESLATALLPSGSTAVSEAVVSRLLRCIAWRDSVLAVELPAAIGRDGSFRLSVLAGMSPQEPARHIGAHARERERLRRIAALDTQIRELEAAVDGERKRLEDLCRRLETADAERQAAPTGREIRDAQRAVELASKRLVDAEERRRRAQDRLRDAEKRVRAARVDLSQRAAAHRLPTTSEELGRYAARVRDLERLVRRWATAAQAHLVAEAALRDHRDERERRLRERNDAEVEHRRARESHHRLATRLAALDEAVGLEYRQLTALIEKARHEQIGLKHRTEEINESLRDIAKELGRLEKTVQSARADREQAEERRSTCHAQFTAMIADGIAIDAAVAVPESVQTATSILAAARKLAGDLKGVTGSTQATARARNAVLDAQHKAGQELGGRVDFSFEESSEGPWSLLRATSEGIRKSIPQLVESLSEELEIAQTELDEREQRLFDETLTGSVRQHVAGRIRLASELVARLNRELGSVRTDVAGVGVRLKWTVDDADSSSVAVSAARQLLLKDPADLSAEERTRLYEFFRDRIDLVRTGDDEIAGWDAQLVAALDYRSWHRFQLQLAHASWDGYRDATRSRWGNLSTGEKSIALHLPMLASIVAHYGAHAEAGCPRLIVLDELFAGVDPSNRAKLLGMLVTWDLDAVFTSDHEWCTYPSLDGIAIHHVHAEGHEVGDPVTTSRFVWNGRERTESAVEDEIAP